VVDLAQANEALRAKHRGDVERRLEAGDIVELEVEWIGALRNRICRN
jgi:2-keto-4-pentenoate hydratase/2-oxohepta-3-ene-1,7-dioic acid hydratase in catechol pathway